MKRTEAGYSENLFRFLKAFLRLPVLLALFILPAKAEISAWILFDADSGEVFDHIGEHKIWHPASLAKMMTAYVVFSEIRDGRISLESNVTIPKNVKEIPASKIGFPAGAKLTVESAITLIIVKSANDIAVALAESLSGSEQSFVERMNIEAHRLGMTRTVFTNPHGLPDKRQVTSARDIAVLAQALWQEFPQYRKYYSISGVRVGNRVLWSANRNFLSRVEGAVGLKTGYICDSGFNVAAVVERENRTMIAIILGAGSSLERSSFASKLMNAGFSIPRTDLFISNRISEMHPSEISLNPPEKGYCKRNKPKASQLFAFSAVHEESSSGFEEIERIFARPGTKEVSRQSEKLPNLKGNGKTDWNRLMDVVIGPQRIEEKIVNVSLVKSSNSMTSKRPVDIGKLVLPRSKPTDSR